MNTSSTVRVLNACAKCDRQYDVSHLDAGRKVLCECGERFEVTIQKPHDPRVLKCGHCGGLLKDGARACEYCSAEITLEERRLSAVCPRCFARMAVDACYCMECGVKIDPQALYAVAEGTVCLRCKSALRSRALGNIQMLECSRCGGSWLATPAFVRLCEQAEAERAADAALASARIPAQTPEPKPIRYLPCLACGSLMGRKNYGTSSGVIIDVCAAHGVWLDEAELHKILSFIRAGGLERQRRREIERLREEERRAESAKVRVETQWTSRPRAFSRPRGAVDPSVLVNWILESL